jgi:hypothetical protein
MPRPPYTRWMQVVAMAAAWFVVLTLLNIGTGGHLRGTILYAVPVAFAAWHDLRLGFVFAAVGALSAWVGGSIPQPGLLEPVWTEGLFAFLRLSAVAVGTRIALRELAKHHPS